MKKILNATVIVILLLIPAAILYQSVRQYFGTRTYEPSSEPAMKPAKGPPMMDPGGKPPKNQKDGVDPAQKAGKAKKQAVAAADLPAAVKSALEKQAADLNFDKLEVENKNGQVVYTAKWGDKASEREIKLAADGTPLEAKEMVAFDSLPANVREAIQQARPSATTFECKKQSTFEDAQLTVVYEVKTQAAGEKLPPLRVFADGTVKEAKGGKAK